MRDYFSDLKRRYGIELSEGQKAWYATQYRINGAEVKQEFPTVPEEALQTSVEGLFTEVDFCPAGRGEDRRRV